MSDDQAREMRPETTSEHIARDMREGRFPEQSERQMVPVLASLPHEIQVWRSMDALDHTGTWSTTRYPAEAVTYVSKADAQAAQAMVVERCAEFVERQGTWMQEHNLVGNGYDLVQQGKCLRALAPIDGLALVRELRADVERLNRWRAEEGEKIKRQAKALTDLTKHCQRIEAENAGLARKIGKVQRGDGDHSQIADLEAKVINQRNELANLMARDGRLAELAADRYRLAAANAALEAKVAGLVEALAGLLCAITDTDQIGDRKLTITGGTEALRWLLDAEDAARATLATQEAGNAQSTPPISPEEAQFNAVRYHERFGPLDEKGNPLDPRRRG